MARLGQRYLRPCTSIGVKTGRHYGAIVSLVRQVARSGKPFTRLDLPGLTADQGSQVLHGLCRLGELRCLKRGRPGRGVVVAVYQLVSQ